ncbi:hypothetical protein Cgig2_001018 [Carnegiea gigantea]|uniref:Uncharacterized protein n=1 Tax=Carnegiea gigantea TaxID=171969 RepID=A0A9Q1JQ81_9CARY|nr:hypothetical protein Cgig2_001018 [Carnegiea gigantea]
MLDWLVANFSYPRLDTLSEMGDTFLSELALIKTTLVMAMITLRQQRNIVELVQPHAELQRRETEAKFYVPPSYHEGLFSKTKEIFGVVETAAKIEKSLDVDQVKVLSDQDLTCSSEIPHIEGARDSKGGGADSQNVREFDNPVDLEKAKDRLKNLIGFVSPLTMFIFGSFCLILLHLCFQALVHFVLYDLCYCNKTKTSLPFSLSFPLPFLPFLNYLFLRPFINNNEN